MDDGDLEVNTSTIASSERAEKKEAQRKAIVAPWKNMREFKTVYSWIYGERVTHESKRCACRQMLIWKIRRQNLTPAAVLGTLVILEVQLKDHEYGPSPSPEQLSDLQVFYSSAFTRFFNYMSSIMHGNNGMKTMYETAKRLNLRSFVVDLRHLCAHGQTMPSIEILRSTSSYCLKWLESFYWKGQLECMHDTEIQDVQQKVKIELGDDAIQFFHYYDIVLMSTLSGESKITRKYAKGDQFVGLTQYASKKRTTDPKQLLGYLIKDLGIVVKSQKSAKNLSPAFVDAILKMKYFFGIVRKPIEDTKTLERIIKTTEGLFRMLALYGFIEDLFHGLLSIVENKNEEPDRRLATGFWANQIVLGFIAFRHCKEVHKSEREKNPDANLTLISLNYEHTSKKILQYYSRANINVKTTLIFGDSLRRPWVWTFSRSFLDDRISFVDEYSIDLLKNLLCLVEPALTESEISVLQTLLDLNLSNNKSHDCPVIEDSEGPGNDRIYSSVDLLEYLCNDPRQKAMPTPSSSYECDVKKYGIWSLAPECQDWSTCPIGKLIWE